MSAARQHERFDAIVVGAGPAGSTCAYFLARAGLSTLLVDRAAFPRDKPCGGGVSARAATLLPFPLDPVVEDVVDRFEFGFSYGKRFQRVSAQPLVLMTERLELDAFLVSQAVDAGAVFRDRTTVTNVELLPDGATLSAETWAATAAAVIGADGANGTTARRLGLKGAREHLVALEADVPQANVDLSVYRRRLVVQVGTVGGGYAWIFPKLDHLNVGLVGWKSEGPALREQLNRLARSLDLDPASLDNVRGYRLPLRSPGDPLATSRCVLVGDAAGLIDPLTGEGMHSAFLSAKLAAEAVAGLVSRSAPDLSGYAKAVLSTFGGVPAASWGCKAAFDRFPKASYGLLRSPQGWRAMKHILQGQARSKQSSPFPASLLAKLAGDPGRRYLEELAE